MNDGVNLCNPFIFESMSFMLKKIELIDVEKKIILKGVRGTFLKYARVDWCIAYIKLKSRRYLLLYKYFLQYGAII